MKQTRLPNHLFSARLSRRQFVKGLALGGTMLSLAISPARLLAASGTSDGQTTLHGKHFKLNISPQTVNFTGSERMATAINGSVPAPILRWREGDTITLDVTNNLAEDSSIHWHGIILPAKMDGVPGISFAGIAPGATYRYQFEVNQSGTYWYHSHSDFQEQTGMYGAIVIDPIDPEPYSF